MFELQPSTALNNIVSAATCSVPRTAWPGTVATKSYVPSVGVTSRVVVPPPLAHDKSVTRVRTPVNAFIAHSPTSLLPIESAELERRRFSAGFRNRFPAAIEDTSGIVLRHEARTGRRHFAVSGPERHCTTFQTSDSLDRTSATRHRT